MEILNTIKGWVTGITAVLGSLFGLAIFAELLFGRFLGDVSVIANVLVLMETLGDKGFVGLLAMIVVLSVMKKDN